MKRQDKLLRLFSLLMMVLCVGTAQAKPKVTKVVVGISIKGTFGAAGSICLDGGGHDMKIDADPVTGKTRVWVDENDDGHFTATDGDDSELAELMNGATWDDVDIFVGRNTANRDITVTMTGGSVKNIFAGYINVLTDGEPANGEEPDYILPQSNVSINVTGGTVKGCVGVDPRAMTAGAKPFGGKVSIHINHATLNGGDWCNALNIYDRFSDNFFLDPVTPHTVDEFVVTNCTILNDKTVFLSEEQLTDNHLQAFFQSANGNAYTLVNNSAETFTLGSYIYGNNAYSKHVHEIDIKTLNGKINNQGLIKIDKCNGVKYDGDLTAKWEGTAIEKPSHQTKAHSSKEATCNEDGYTKTICTLCNEIFTTVLPAGGNHAFATVKYQGSWNYGQICVRCGEFSGTKTNTNTRSCTHTSQTAVASKEPECVTTGTYSHFKCNSCNSLLVQKGSDFVEVESMPEIPALGHKFEWMNLGKAKKEPTCTEPGVYYYCCDRMVTGRYGKSRCGAYSVDEDLTFESDVFCGHAYYIKSIDRLSEADPYHGSLTIGCNKCDLAIDYPFDNRDAGLASVLKVPTCERGWGTYSINFNFGGTGMWKQYDSFIDPLYDTNDDGTIKTEGGKSVYLLHDYDLDGKCKNHEHTAAAIGGFVWYATQTDAPEGLSVTDRYITAETFATEAEAKSRIASLEAEWAADTDNGWRNQELHLGVFHDKDLSDIDDMEAHNIVYDLNGHVLKSTGAYTGSRYGSYFYTNCAFEIVDNVAFDDQTDGGVYYLGITADKVKYDRAVAGGSIVTFILPVAVPIDQFNGTVYSFTGYSGGTFHFSKVIPDEYNNYTAADTPYLVKMNSNATTLLEDGCVKPNTEYGNITLYLGNAPKAVTPDASDAKHFGSYTVQSVASDGADTYFGYNGGQFYRVPSGKINPYRTAFTVPTASVQDVRAVRLQLDDGFTTTIVEVDADALTGQGAPFYDLLGRKVQTMQRGNIYITNGKKIMK